MTFAYQTGGSLPLSSPTYIKRQADDDLYGGLLKGEFCYVLTSRQMGKSSLRIQVMARLQQAGVKCSAIDLTGIGSQNITAEQWYYGVMDGLMTDLGLTEVVDLDRFWDRYENLAPLQRLNKFVETVVLSHITAPVVVFVDEIDSIISLDFDTDDFFAWIRYCLNLRADRVPYQRLTFCLLGVATPKDLIQDRTRTPFNIGKSIEPLRFQEEQLDPLMVGLHSQVADCVRVRQEIYHWTGGQPFLTQRLCSLIQSELGRIELGQEAELIGRLVQERMISNWEFQDEQSHLKTIRDRLLKDEEKAVKLLSIYQHVLQHNSIAAVGEASVLAEVNTSQPLTMSGDNLPEIMALKLTGLVISEQGKLSPYNQIYQRVFNAEWVTQELAKLRPYAGSLAEWLAKGREDRYLLAGEILQQAQQWALTRRLTEEDYQYLTASQKLDVEKAKAEAEEIIKKTKIEAEQITQKAKKRAALFTTLGVSGLIGAGIASGVALFNANELTWRTKIEQGSVEALYLPDRSLDRSIAVMKLGRELNQKVRDEPIGQYPTYAPLASLRQVLPTNWREANRLSHQAEVSSVAVSGDGNNIVSGSRDKTVKVWHFDLDYLLAKGCEQLQDYFHTHPQENQMDNGEKICPK